jgi:hypothetical protein
MHVVEEEDEDRHWVDAGGDWRVEAQKNGVSAVERWRGRGVQQWELRQVTTSSCAVLDRPAEEHQPLLREEGRGMTQLHALVSWQTTMMDSSLTHTAAEAAAWRYPAPGYPRGEY